MTVAAVFASVSISGCANRIIDFTALSSKNVDIPGVRGERVRGEDMASIVIFIPTGTPNIKEAVDDALEKGNGDLLIDGVIYNKMWYIPYVFGRFGFVVEGTVVNTKKAPPPVGERQALPMTKTVPPPAPQAAPPSAPAAQETKIEAPAPPAPQEPPAPQPQKSTKSYDDQL
ncbi:MAG TPA: hypothetical protein DEB40_09670 [Elusimicrobia bacterium]|nr:hypothetical protein [Elusimicrobiota bacterium]HBT61997.1 hypothetical protein [Elusimicrobiota bacterium]